MKWFRHDSDTTYSTQIKKLRHRWGLEGVGLYWVLMESIARGVHPDNLSFELEDDAEVIANEFGMPREKVEDMMNYMVELKLFQNECGVITCMKLLDLSDRYTKLVTKERSDAYTKSEKVPLHNITLHNKTKKKTHMPSAKQSGPTVQSIVNLYHEKLPMLPSIKKMTKTREGYIKQRIRESDLPDIETWEKFFMYVSRSDFLCGRAGSTNGRPPFRADLEWICRPANYAKIFEGKYHV